MAGIWPAAGRAREAATHLPGASFPTHGTRGAGAETGDEERGRRRGGATARGANRTPTTAPLHALPLPLFHALGVPGPAGPRPSEPILIPKLRIELADFPYLHWSYVARGC